MARNHIEICSKKNKFDKQDTKCVFERGFQAMYIKFMYVYFVTSISPTIDCPSVLNSPSVPSHLHWCNSCHSDWNKSQASSKHITKQEESRPCGFEALKKTGYDNMFCSCFLPPNISPWRSSLRMKHLFRVLAPVIFLWNKSSLVWILQVGSKLQLPNGL